MTSTSKTKEYTQEIIELQEFQSSIPAFGQSSNPIDLNMGVQNRYTGYQGVKQFDNLAGGNNQQEVVFEIPFDIKAVLGYTIFSNALNQTGDEGGVSGNCSGSTVKPFGDTIESYRNGGFRGNFCGSRNTTIIHKNIASNLIVVSESIDQIITDITVTGSNPVTDVGYSWLQPSTGKILVDATWDVGDIPVPNIVPFVSSGHGLAGDSFYPDVSDYNFLVYPDNREDRRVTLKCDIKDGWYAFCVFTFL